MSHCRPLSLVPCPAHLRGIFKVFFDLMHTAFPLATASRKGPIYKWWSFVRLTRLWAKLFVSMDVFNPWRHRPCQDSETFLYTGVCSLGKCWERSLACSFEIVVFLSPFLWEEKVLFFLRIFIYFPQSNVCLACSKKVQVLQNLNHFQGRP